MNKPLISVSNIIFCTGLKGTVVDALCKALVAYRFDRKERCFKAKFCCGHLVYFVLFCALLFPIVGLFGFTSSLCVHHGMVTSLSCVLFCLRACLCGAMMFFIFFSFQFPFLCPVFVVCPLPVSVLSNERAWKLRALHVGNV